VPCNRNESNVFEGSVLNKAPGLGNVKRILEFAMQNSAGLVRIIVNTAAKAVFYNTTTDFAYVDPFNQRNPVTK